MSQALHARIAELEAEVAALKHDLRQYMSIANTEANLATELHAEVAALRQAAANNAARTSDMEARLTAAEKDAGRYRLAVRYEDNAGLLYTAVISHCPDKAAIDAEFDEESIEVELTPSAG